MRRISPERTTKGDEVAVFHIVGKSEEDRASRTVLEDEQLLDEVVCGIFEKHTKTTWMRTEAESLEPERGTI